MPEINSSNTDFNSCPYCGWEFSAELCQKVSEINERAFCEGCGTEIVKEIEQPNEDTSKHDRKNLISKIYENLRNKKSSVDRVLDDSDFPLIFIENYIIVASRLIYFHFLELKKEGVFDFQQSELTEETIEIIYKRLKSITTKRINPKFLRNLKNLSIKRFEKWLKFQQSKLEVSEKYFEDLTYFLQELVEKVFTIITELWDEKEPPKFDRIIRDDLKKFSFSLDNYITIIGLKNESSGNQSANFENINLASVLKRITLTNSFRGDLLNKVKDVVYNLIESENLQYRDFNSEGLIITILNQLGIPCTNEEVDNSNIIDKKTAKRRLINKKIYISILGKIMIDILNFSSNDSITDISERYNVSRDFTTKTARYLSKKHKFELKDRFPTTSARGSNTSPSKKTLEEIKSFSLNFKDPDFVREKATEIFKDIISGSKKLTVDDLPLGYKTDPKYLAYSLIYYALRFKSYSMKYNEFESFGVIEFINQNFPDDITMKLAMTNTIPTLYNYISEKLKTKIHYHPIIKIPGKKYTRFGFVNKLKDLKRQYEETNRPDNVALINLIEVTLSYYEKGKFTQFIEDLQFWTKRNKAWVLVEKLSIPDTLRIKADLEDFVRKYSNLIKTLNFDESKAEKLSELLETFEEMRYIHYNYKNSYKEKKRRGYERRLTYGDYFFKPSSRIKRFLLMLGFSPYDGFDIWGNKIIIDGACKIFANFHHYHYNPEDQSEDDLVFIPVKPPKSFRTKVYQKEVYLTHNMIAGREGHLKKDITSKEKKQQIRNDLKEIEERIEFNSKLIEKAVLALDSDLLKKLIGWSETKISKIIARLSDKKFMWAKGIEKSIPLTKENAQKRISSNEAKKIIQNILMERKKL